MKRISNLVANDQNRESDSAAVLWKEILKAFGGLKSRMGHAWKRWKREASRLILGVS